MAALFDVRKVPDACQRCGMAAGTCRELKRRIGRFGASVDEEMLHRMREFVDPADDRDIDLEHADSRVR